METPLVVLVLIRERAVNNEGQFNFIEDSVAVNLKLLSGLLTGLLIRIQ